MREPEPVEELTEAQAKSEHEFLVRELERHDRLYYKEDQPEISDAEYDRLRQRIEALEQRFPDLATETSPTQKVGARPPRNSPRSATPCAMLSLGNVFSDEEARDFVGRVHRFLKLGAEHAARCHRRAEDRRPVGLAALRARRARGAATRGDGSEGEDVTANVRTIARHSRPAQGPDFPTCSKFAARSTCATPISPRSMSGRRRAASSSPIRATPPPALCASSIRASPRRGRSRFFAYAMGCMDQRRGLTSQMELLEQLRAWGFPTNTDYRHLDTIDEC